MVTINSTAAASCYYHREDDPTVHSHDDAETRSLPHAIILHMYKFCSTTEILHGIFMLHATCQIEPWIEQTCCNQNRLQDYLLCNVHKGVKL